MRRRRNNKVFLFLVLILFISIGYALLNTTLNINGVAGFKNNTWKIVWDSDSVEVTSGSTSEVVPVVNQEKDTVTYNTELSLPGDFYEFTVDAVNEGTVDGVLSVNALTPVITNEEGEEIDLPEGLIYTIKYADGGEIKKNHLLKAGEREKYRVRLEFDVNAKHTLEAQEIGIETSIPYEQTNKDAIDRDTEKYTITFNPNDGEVDETTKKVVMELPIGELPTPIRAGYSFDGWYTELDGGVKITKDTIPTANTEYFAHWTERVSTFDIGKNVNAKIKKLAGDTMPETNPYSTEDTNITSIVKSDTAPDISLMTSDNIISREEEEYPIYAWFDQGTIYFWSDVNTSYLNEDCSFLFNYMQNISNIDFDNMNSSKVENMSYLFNGVNSSTIDLSKLDTSNTTSMEGMFTSSKFTTLNIENWDVSNLVNADRMFYYTNVQSLDLSNWNTPNLEKVYGMFYNSSKLENLDVSGLNTSKVKTMEIMFCGCSSLTELDLLNFDTSNVTNMNNMFGGCSSLTKVNVSSFDTRKVTKMIYTFGGCSSLRELDLSNFRTDSITTISGLLANTDNLEKLNLSNWDLRNVDYTRSFMMGVSNGGFKKLKKVIFNDVIFSSDAYYFFGGLSALEEISLNNVNTKIVTNMNSMFLGCNNLKNIDLSSFNTKNVTDMSSMFNNCNSLTEIDVSNFDTSNVTNMMSIFYGCSSLKTLDLSNFDISKATSVGAVVSSCTSLTELNISNWDFKKSSEKLNLMNITGGGSSTLKKVLLNNITVDDDLSYAFSGMSSIEEIYLNNVDTRNVTNMENMFKDCSNLKTIIVSDNFIVDQVTDSTNMFINDTSLIGGNGTIYDENHIDKEYAHYDGGTSNPGYFNKASTANMLTITLKDGENIYRTLKIEEGTAIGSLPKFNKEGYVFDGWYTAITDGIKVDKTYIPSSDITLYTRYLSIPYIYTISFNSNGGDPSVTTRLVSEGETIDLLTPIKENNSFVGWWTGLTDGVQVDSSYAPTSDITLYARWTSLIPVSEPVCAENENITNLSATKCNNNVGVSVPQETICKRAIQLHQEECTQTVSDRYCSGAGYTESGSKGTSTITYGNCGISGTLTSGDAFTCDVNGDGTFDELAERFYYVSDYYDTTNKNFDSTTAVLIFYNNVTDGISCNRHSYAYHAETLDNVHGPETIKQQLPKTTQWNSVRLKNTSRAILAEELSTHDSPTTKKGTLPTAFNYSKYYSARLLTAKELMSGCGLSQVQRWSVGDLDACNYLLENTEYAKGRISGDYWLETPRVDDYYGIWFIDGNGRCFYSIGSSTTYTAGARPVIEVSKSKISY